MKLFKEEIYKLFVKRKFMVFFAFVMIIEAVLAFSSSNGIKLTDKASQKKYESYMAEFSGELSDEKINAIESLISEDEKMTQKRSQMQKKYIECEISDKEYTEFLREYNEYIIGYEGFAAFTQDYSNAMETQSSLIDSKPWNSLFKNESIDFICVLLITLCVILLFVSDIESGTEAITFCSQNGKGRKFSVQMLICMFSAITSSLLTSYIRYAVIDLTYGLGNKSLSLCSLELFSESTYDMTITGAYVLVSVIKAFGSIYLAVFTYFIGSILKKSLLTGFASFVTVFLPNYLLPDREYKYLLPLPSAFLTANGYLFGDRVNDMIYFKGLTSIQLTLVFILAILLMLSFTIGAYLITARRAKA